MSTTRSSLARAVPGSPPADGRAARSQRSRDAVVDALLELLQEGDLRPTAARIAERAQVSLRLVFQHFADLETLFAAAADRHTARMATLVRRIDATGALAGRLADFVDQRARLLEAIAPVRTASELMAPFSPEVSGRLQQARELGRREVARVFAAEIAARPARDQAEFTAALAATASWGFWRELREHQGLAVADARRVLSRTLGRLLTP